MNDTDDDSVSVVPGITAANVLPAVPVVDVADPVLLVGLAADVFEVPAVASGATEGEVAKSPPILAGKYVLKRELARGAMGRVYLATQLGLNRNVAVKVMSPKLDDPDFRRRFMLEATGLANLSHRNVVTVYDYGESRRGMLYLVLEYLEGRTLAQVIKAERSVSVARTLMITNQILRGLRAAHKKGIVHRDLKPSNIFVVKGEDGEEEIKILDFGVAKLFDTDDVNMDATRDGIMLGTPAFMAPEQIDGTRVGPYTDLYAIGCVIFSLLSGRVPFPGKNDVEILHAQLHQPPPSLRSLPGFEGLPEVVEAFVTRLLQKRPDNRYVDCDAALNALRTLTTELLSSDTGFRLQFTPDAAASMYSTGGEAGSSHGARFDSSAARLRPETNELRRLDDNSSPPGFASSSSFSSTFLTSPALAASPPTSETAFVAPPARRLWTFAIVGGLAAFALVAITATILRGWTARVVTVDTIPGGLTLIDERGRVLGEGPVTFETSDTVLRLRARRGDAISAVRELPSAGGHVLADFSDWTKTLESGAPATITPPAAVPGLLAAPLKPDAPSAAPKSAVARGRARASRPSTPSPPPPPPPPPSTASTTSKTTTAPPTAPVRPEIQLLDDVTGKKPGIGILDDAPHIAPLD